MTTLYTDKHRIPFEVDEEDVEAVSRYSWHLGSSGRAGGPGRYILTAIGKWPKQRPLSLHVFLLGKAPAGLEWDHVNRNKHDCRRSNLRLVTRQQNRRNTGPQRNNRTGVKGVWIDRGMIRAAIKMDGRTRHLGRFGSIEQAAAARAEAESELWG